MEYLQENITEEDLLNANQFSIKTLEPFTPDSELFLTPKTSPSCVTSTITSTFTNPRPDPSVGESANGSEEPNLLEQELTEQDELLTAFQSILKTQKTVAGKLTPASRIKPTTLSLRSSHTSKVFKHSGSCDFNRFKRLNNQSVNTQKGNPYRPKTEGHEWANPSSQFYSPCRPKTDHAIISYQDGDNKKDNFTSHSKKEVRNDFKYDENSQVSEGFTPDSLVDEDDDNSSPSDYLTPGTNFCPSLLEPIFINKIFVKSRSHSMPVEMENIITTVDSGLETTSVSSGLVESHGSPREHTESETSGIDYTESLFSSDPLKDDDSQSYSFNYSRHPDASHQDGSNVKELISIKEKGEPSLLSPSSQTFIGETSSSSLIGRIIDKRNNANHTSQTCQDLVDLGISVNSDSPYGSEWGSERYTNSNTAETDSEDLANLHYRCETEFCKTSSKEEKERLNEEIVILESSSVSSETGSWESIFPPKNVVEIKEVCNAFIKHEQKYSSDYSAFVEKRSTSNIDHILSAKVKTACFIDATALADDGELFLNSKPTKSSLCESANHVQRSEPITNNNLNHISPTDIDAENSSEASNNEDSLELAEFDELEKAVSTHDEEISYATQHNDSKFSHDNSACTMFEQDGGEKSLTTSDQSNTMSMESTCVVPKTPSNSIMQIDWKRSFQGNESNGTLPDSPRSNSHFDSPHRMQKCDESMPIVSGGATIEDFVTNIQQTSHSLPNNLALLMNDGHKGSPKSSWIVDMSDCKKNDYSEAERYISLNHSVIEKDSYDKVSDENYYSEKKTSLGFYVDFSNMPTEAEAKLTSLENDKLKQKKSLFSMYVDLGNNKNLKEMPSRLVLNAEGKKDISLKNVQENEKPVVLSDENKDSEEEQHTVVEMVTDKIPLRSNPQLNMLRKEIDPLSKNNKPGSNVNRHSWNFTDCKAEADPQNKLKNLHKHKSLSMSKFSETSPEFINQMNTKKESNYSLSDVSLVDDLTTCSKSESSCSENIAIALDNKGLHPIDGANAKKHKCDAKLNETFDKSSTCSDKNNLTEDTSPTITDNEELTFHPEPILAKVEVQDQMTDSIEGLVEDLPTSDTTSMNSKDTEKELDTSDTSKISNFVRLSDLDKPLPALNLDITREHFKNPVNSRMTRSIPEASWVEDNRMTHSTEIFSSFHSENIYSLTRLFPHLKNELSKSTPGSLGAQNRSLTYLPTPGLYLRDTELLYSDVTEHSSLQSSSCFSANGEHT